MRWTVVIGALMVATTPAARAERPCPPGAEQRGAAPPAGHAVWCVAGGVHHGPWAMWFLDGTLMREGFLHQGRMQGRFASWHKNGQLAEESFFRAGVRVGVWHAWRADGTPIYVTGYRNGKKHGYDKRYHPNGKLASSTRWRWGKRHGSHIERDDHGKLMVRGYYQKDQRQGTWTTYAEHPGHRIERVYREGKLASVRIDGRPSTALCPAIVAHIHRLDQREAKFDWPGRCQRAALDPGALLCMLEANTASAASGCYLVRIDTTD